MKDNITFMIAMFLILMIMRKSLMIKMVIIGWLLERHFMRTTLVITSFVKLWFKILSLIIQREMKRIAIKHHLIKIGKWKQADLVSSGGQGLGYNVKV